MKNQVIGILAMAYGTPRKVEEIEPYYTHIRRGRPPEAHQLQELVDRYAAIGGLSPLNEITDRQVRGLEDTLNRMDPANTYRVYTGLKHTHPFIKETIQEMLQDGISKAIGVVLAPHYSTMSVGTYIQYANDALEKFGGLDLKFVENWHLEPKFLESTARRVEEVLAKFGPEQDEVEVLFTAHSLPERILQIGDPYPEQIRESASEVAKIIGHEKWSCGWQSAGRTHEPWLGPDILDLMRKKREEGVKNLVICPFGFVSDHLEVLYDIDIEAQALAKELGMHLERPASPNEESLFLEAVATAVLAQMES